MRFARIYMLVSYYVLNYALFGTAFTLALTVPFLVLCLLGIYLEYSRWFNVNDMIWLIAYLFFVISPLQNFHGGYFDQGPVYLIKFSNIEFFEAYLSIFIFFLVHFAIRFAFRKQSVTVTFVNIPKFMSLYIFAVNVLFFAMTVLTNGGFEILSASRYDKFGEARGVLAMPSEAILMTTTFMLALLFKNARPRDRIFLGAIFAFSLTFLAVCFNPFNTARYFMLAAWLPVILIFLKGKIEANATYVLLLLAIVFVMPVFNLTSRESYTLPGAIETVMSDSEPFKTAFSDALDMETYEIQYMENHSYYYGQKSLGLLLFFIPRDIWTSKATLMGLDLGAVLEDNKVAGTSNLSMFVAGDFYSDGGLIGVIIGALIVNLFLIRGFFLKKRLIDGADLNSYILTAAIPILIRGPLGANVGLTFFELVSVAILVRVIALVPSSRFSVRSNL